MRIHLRHMDEDLLSSMLESVLYYIDYELTVEYTACYIDVSDDDIIAVRNALDMIDVTVIREEL